MGKGDGEGGARAKEGRIAVPAMPLPLAILCCVINFILPGVGTIIAGFTAFCCSRNEDLSGGARCGSCCMSFAIGLLQFFLTVIFFIGWIWSYVWGVLFIGMSASYYHGNSAEENYTAAVTTQPGQVVITTQGLPPGQGSLQPTGHANMGHPGYNSPPAYSAEPSVGHKNAI